MLVMVTYTHMILYFYVNSHAYMYNILIFTRLTHSSRQRDGSDVAVFNSRLDLPRVVLCSSCGTRHGDMSWGKLRFAVSKPKKRKRPCQEVTGRAAIPQFETRRNRVQNTPRYSTIGKYDTRVP